MDSIIKHSLELLGIKSVQEKEEKDAPFGKGTAEALDYVLKLAGSMGFKCVNLDNYIGYAECGEGKPFAVLGHLDTVPIGDGWTKNPLGEIADGNIYGRGALDDKLPMLACLLATGDLLKVKTPKRKIKLIFGLNEESGWKCIEHFNKCEQMPDEGFSPDADFPVIYCEKGIVNFKISLPKIDGFEIHSGERANVVPNICKAKYNGKEYSSNGISAHAATPWQGENAIINMLKMLSDKDEKIARLYKVLSDFYGSGLDLAVSDESGRLTVNTGMAYVDDRLNFVLDIRYPVTYSESFVKDKIQSALPEATIERTHFHLPLKVSSDDTLCKTLLDVYNGYTKQNASPIAIGGGTYARALKHGVAFGPVFPDRPLPIHCPDEMIPIKDLYALYDIYKAAIDKLCF